MGGHFDAFLCHHTADKPWVEALAHRLLDEGFRPWFDKWDLLPGRPWLVELERALVASRVILVCLGPRGLGPVQSAEQRVALESAFEDERRIVIPVLLPGAPPREEIPGFLRSNHWIDLREDSPEEFGALCKALAGEARGPPARHVADCPYRGLEAFEEEHARAFIGREQEVTALLTSLHGGSRLLPVVGASGAGKSSLVLAGLVPAVRSGQLDGSYDWEIIKLRPGVRPCHELAVRLAQLRGSDEASLAKIRGELLRDEQALSDGADLTLAGRPREPRLLVVVDQFEELFTQTERSEDRAAFIRSLLHASGVRGGRVHVVLTLRADFLEACLHADRQLAERLQASMKLVLPMGPEQLREAICRPARQAGVQVEEAVVSSLVQAVHGAPADLPLLQFTLEALWARREGTRLTWSAYAALGGVQGALARQAELVVSAWSDAERQAGRHVFGRLVQIGESPDKHTRRRAPRAEMEAVAPGVAGRMLEALIQVRLLTAYKDSVELAHEALIRKWDRLREWVREDGDALRILDDLRRAAESWEGGGRAGDDLWRGNRLKRAEGFSAASIIPLTQGEKAFLDESLKSEQHEWEEEQQRQRQDVEKALALANEQKLRAEEARAANRRLRWYARILGAALVATAIAIGVGVFGLIRATEQAATEKAVRQEAERLLISEQGTRANILARQPYQGRESLLVALRAADRALRAEQPVPESVIEGLFMSVAGRARPLVIHRGRERNFSDGFIQLSPDGSRVLASGDSGTTRLLDASTGAIIAQLETHDAQFSPDGSLVIGVKMDKDRVPVIWKSSTGETVQRLLAPSDEEEGLEAPSDEEEGLEAPSHQAGMARFLLNGSRVLSEDHETPDHLWDAQSGTLLATLGDAWHTAEVSPSGHRILTWLEHTEESQPTPRSPMQLWDGGTGKLIATLDRLGTPLWAGFSPDGTRLLTTTFEGGSMWLWDAATGKRLASLGGHTGRVWGTFSSDGTRILTHDSEGKARLWETQSRRCIATFDKAGGSPVDRVETEFSPRGSRIVTIHEDGVLRLWDAGSGGLIASMPAPDALVGIVFSPDDSVFVMFARYDRILEVWNAETGTRHGKLSAYDGRIESVKFSNSSRYFLTTGEDFTARIWDTASLELLATLEDGEAGIQEGAFLPGERRYLTLNAQHTLRLWEWAPGMSFEERGLAPQEADISAAQGTELLTLIAFAPDRLLMHKVGKDALLRLGDAPLLTLKDAFSSTYSRYSHVEFSPDGGRVLTMDYGTSPRLWDSRHGKLIKIFEGPATHVNSALFSPDGKHIITAGKDGYARLWDGHSGAEVRVLQKGTGELFFAAFSPLGDRIITTSEDGNAYLLDSTGSLVARLEGQYNTYWTARFSHDGTRVLTWPSGLRSSLGEAERTAWLWNAQTGSFIGKLQGHKDRINLVAFSPDDSRIVTVSEDSRVRLWDASDGRELVRLEVHSTNVWEAEFSPDGARLMTVSRNSQPALWNVSGKLLAVLKGHADVVWHGTFSPDGTRMLTVSKDGTARLWDGRTGLPLAVYRPGYPLSTGGFTEDGRHVVMPNHSGGVSRFPASLEGFLAAACSLLEDPEERVRLSKACPREGQARNTREASSTFP